LTSYEASLAEKVFESKEEMMAVAVEISARNVESGTGGPFGAAVFERSKSMQTSRLFAVGANRVVNLNNSTLHGETVALQFAQQKLQSFSLRSDGDKEYVLCTSCEPCAMCLGATFWSGVSEMVCAATKEDAESIGFDEGPVFPESYCKLEEVGTKVTRRILRDEGAKVLKDYGSSTGIIYN
jgi:tRNA(Arg) A34 adenosine deaminase TadA